MWQTVRNDRLFLVLLLGLIALAWVSLWVWGQSPYGRFLDHEALTDVTSEDVRLLVFFAAGWTLMISAMMLPTTVPLASLFRGLVARRAHAPLLLTLLLVGYLTAWLAFGVAALGLLWAIDQARASIIFSQAWVWGAGLFLLAGAFQFSALKYACLDKCRTPLGFLISHWHGRREISEAFNVGWRHGLFCVGCCWALMLLMFAVSTASLAWMLMLAVIMAVEKNASWGRRLGHPLGVVLLGVGVGLGIYNLTI